MFKAFISDLTLLFWFFCYKLFCHAAHIHYFLWYPRDWTIRFCRWWFCSFCKFHVLDNLKLIYNPFFFQVRKAYRKKALETHPDKLEPGASEAEKQDAEQQFHKVSLSFFFTYSESLLDDSLHDSQYFETFYFRSTRHSKFLGMLWNARLVFLRLFVWNANPSLYKLLAGVWYATQSKSQSPINLRRSSA